MSDRPNILLLVIDCLRADHVYEDGLCHIPAVRSLVERGFAFRNAIASTTTTTPSFASLLTGRYPFEHGVRTHHGGKLSESVLMMPQLLQQAGYHTYAEACGPLGVEVGMDRGFDEYVHRGRRAVITGAWGKELMEKLGGHYQEPWFLMLHVWALHKPRQILSERSAQECGRTEYARSFSSIDLRLGPVLDTLPPGTAVVFTGDHGEEIPTGWLDKRVRRIRKQVFLFKKRHGLTKTHISIGSRDCSDGHGFAIYDHLVKVPLILAGAGRIPAGRSEVQVRHVDVAPTVLDLAGVPVPEDITGRSLLSIVEGDDVHRDAYLEAVGSGLGTTNAWLAGIRVDNRYKYIYAPFYDLFVPELYDLAADPGERSNIAAEQPDVVADLLSRIGAIQQRARTAGVPLSDKEQATVLERLKDLGYLDE